MQRRLIYTVVALMSVVPVFAKGPTKRILNIGTIIRDGREGHWYQATEGWSRAINARLP